MECISSVSHFRIHIARTHTHTSECYDALLPSAYVHQYIAQSEMNEWQCFIIYENITPPLDRNMASYRFTYGSVLDVIVVVLRGGGGDGSSVAFSVIFVVTAETVMFLACANGGGCNNNNNIPLHHPHSHEHYRFHLLLLSTWMLNSYNFSSAYSLLRMANHGNVETRL